jgi:hypothetical protein
MGNPGDDERIKERHRTIKDYGKSYMKSLKYDIVSKIKLELMFSMPYIPAPNRLLCDGNP